ncbi:MAG: hypothetical protein K2P81_11220 [Bacteriovoracaceae bacterium]|nr:hypothetical protein [Bacteriovoracaceae bacterium]
MQVLVKNPWANFEVPKTLDESFWSSNSFYLKKDFSFSSMFELDTDFSPFLSLDMRMSFISSLPREGQSLSCQGVSALTLIACFFQTKTHIFHDLPEAELTPLLNEYLPADLHHFFSRSQGPTDQVLILNHEPDLLMLNEKLMKKGRLILVSTQGAIAFSPHPKDYEAWGRLWPMGEATEFGWRFTKDCVGLEGLEFSQFNKS